MTCFFKFFKYVITSFYPVSLININLYVCN